MPHYVLDPAVTKSDNLLAMKKRMTPYETVIDRFESVGRLAAALGVGHTTILKWKRRGLIPSHQIQRIYTVASEMKIKISLEDLVFGGFKNDAAERKKEASEVTLRKAA